MKNQMYLSFKSSEIAQCEGKTIEVAATSNKRGKITKPLCTSSKKWCIFH